MQCLYTRYPVATWGVFPSKRLWPFHILHFPFSPLIGCMRESWHFLLHCAPRMMFWKHLNTENLVGHALSVAAISNSSGCLSVIVGWCLLANIWVICNIQWGLHLTKQRFYLKFVNRIFAVVILHLEMFFLWLHYPEIWVSFSCFLLWVNMLGKTCLGGSFIYCWWIHWVFRRMFFIWVKVLIHHILECTCLQAKKYVGSTLGHRQHDRRCL